jgi:hypothetical protein
METACDKAGCLWCEGGGVQEGVGFCGPKATCEYRHDNIIVSLTKDKCAYHYVHANDGACAQIGKDCCDDSEEFLKDENDCYDLVGSASVFVAFICVPCTLRTQISRSIYNSVSTSINNNNDNNFTINIQLRFYRTSTTTTRVT